MHMASVIERKQTTTLYAYVVDVWGKRRQIATPFKIGEDEKALEWAAELEGSVSRERAARRRMIGSAVETFATFARAWYAPRRNAAARVERGRLENHIIPRIGDKPLAELTCGDGEAIAMALKNAGLAPRTICGILTQGYSVMESAGAAGKHQGRNPFKLRAGVRPKKVDKDPSWRRAAIFSRRECRVLLGSSRIPGARRVLYGLKFLAMLRHGEASTLLWEQWTKRNLPRPGSVKCSKIELRHTKSFVPREIPVHPTLHDMLDWWWREGWERAFGRAPGPTDLICPNRHLRVRTSKRAQVALVGDLRRHSLRIEAGALKNSKGQVRSRRGHDLRRTGITVAREHGAGPLLSYISHGPSPSMIDQYTSPRWKALSRTMLKIPFKLEAPLSAAQLAQRDLGGAADPVIAAA